MFLTNIKIHGTISLSCVFLLAFYVCHCDYFGLPNVASVVCLCVDCMLGNAMIKLEIGNIPTKYSVHKELFFSLLRNVSK